MAQKERETPATRKITTLWDGVRSVCDRPGDTPGGRSRVLGAVSLETLGGRAAGAGRGRCAAGTVTIRGLGASGAGAQGL